MPLNKVEKMKCPVEESQVRPMRHKEQNIEPSLCCLFRTKQETEKKEQARVGNSVTNLREPGL